MIAIDTNVLLRYLLDDDKTQAVKAEKIIKGKEIVLIIDVVLVETIWTLKGKKYQLNKTDLIAVIQALFKEPNIRFEKGQVVWQALNDYRKAKPVNGKLADFSDALIVNKAKFIANEKSEVLKGVYTFDNAAQQLPGTKAP
ncbi:MAG: type II toxin-antitoxin system VapC family toxin [Methylococcales bacterium]|nr:type II toxin-antitoxin system VapC family toxin [Methylococcales bacterium]